MKHDFVATRLSGKSRDSRQIRELMGLYPFAKDPGIPRIAPGINGVLLFRVGPLFYATKTSAARLWEWADEMPEVVIWHEMTDFRHQVTFHSDDLRRVVNCVLDHGDLIIVI